MTPGLYPSAELAFGTAIFAAILAAASVWGAGRSIVRWSFAAGVSFLAFEELCKGLTLLSVSAGHVLQLQGLRFAAAAFLPGSWGVFSLTLGRAKYREALRSQKWLLALIAAAPPALVAVFHTSLFEPPFLDQRAAWILPLAFAGKTFQVAFLLGSVFVLANLERTFRASVGLIRWKIKFIVLGVAILCALWIYRSSQALMYSAVDTSLGTPQSAATAGVCFLFVWALFRSRFLDVEVYMSRSSIQYSLTVLLVGVYLLAVGILAQWVRRFTSPGTLPWDSLLILLTLMGLGVLLLSDRLRERLKRIVAQHFRRPLHDYRKAWMSLTERTREILDTQELSSQVARIISETFSILSVNIWLRERNETRLSLVGSTVFTRAQARALERHGKQVAEVLEAAAEVEFAVDLREHPLEWASNMMTAAADAYAEYPMRYILPMKVGNQLVGIITLNDDRVGHAPLSIEDHDLLRAYATQLGVGLLQIRLSERRQQAREIESFQNVSAFVIHDLKNLASRLSLTMQNLRVHSDNPEFREEAFRVISQSVSRVEEMCGRLSMLRQKIDLKMEKASLNELVEKAMRELGSTLRSGIQKSLQPMPEVLVDTDQVHKVLTNLVLNAEQANGNGGHIQVSTEQRGEYGLVSVADNGCGISQEFMQKSLFKPFRTTKSKGMGIGLFQCKMIVEAHRGRIEVESREGEGSTFRVFLPLAGN